MKTKLCSKCKTTKDFTNFGNHRKTRDGKDSWCKDCKREDHRLRNRTPERKAYNKRYNQSAKAKEQRKEYYQRPEVKKRCAEKQREYSKNPLLRMKHEARWQVSRKIVTGVLVRPEICSLCEKPGKIESHHPDYYKPLDIIWVCKLCHQQLTDATNALAEKEG